MIMMLYCCYVHTDVLFFQVGGQLKVQVKR